MAAARRRRLQTRAEIRQHNNTRPRCAGCGNDLPIFTRGDIITPMQMVTPGYEWMAQLDFRPGDLICFWCVMEIADAPLQWGHG
jgi:hypothetical protein